MSLDAQGYLQVVLNRIRFLEFGEGIEGESTEVGRLIREKDASIDQELEVQVWRPGDAEHGNVLGVGRQQSLETIGLFANWYFSRPAGWCRAWANRKSRHFHSAELLGRIEAALEYGGRLIEPEMPRHGAWYMWDIGYPQEIAYCLIFCGDAIGVELRRRLERCLLGMPNKVFRIEAGQGIVHPVQAGANVMHVLENLLLRALAVKDVSWLDAAASQVLMAIGRGEDGQGVQEDWSYHFHGRGVNAGYGITSALLQARWIFLTQGTPWAVGDEVMRLHLGVLREFFRFNIWRGRNSPYSIDRAIANPTGLKAAGSLVLFGLGMLSGLSPQDEEMCAAAMLQSIGTEAEAISEMSAAVVRHSCLAKARAVAKPYWGIRYYPCSEYLLCHRQDWFAAVRMSSVRTKGWNSQNGIHVHGSSSAEFSVALMTDGKEFDTSTVPTMDWCHLMGVTRTNAIENPPEGYGKSDFVGGLAGEELAVMGMQYLLAPPGQDTLRANKSLFIAGQAMVMLGSEIRCDADEPVDTTLFHAPLRQGAGYFRNGTPLDEMEDQDYAVEAGDWVLLDNVAVQLLRPATLSFSTRRGSYGDMNLADKTEFGPNAKVYEHRWVYVISHHGVRPRGGEYGAMLWPAVNSHFVPPSGDLEVRLDPSHHVVKLREHDAGAEVRFPGDYRTPAGLSYPAAEPFKWGSLARWMRAEEEQSFNIELLVPRRYPRSAEAHTEVFLPEGFQCQFVSLVTMEGKPFPGHLISTVADGQVKSIKAKRVGSD